MIEQTDETLEVVYNSTLDGNRSWAGSVGAGAYSQGFWQAVYGYNVPAQLLQDGGWSNGREAACCVSFKTPADWGFYHRALRQLGWERLEVSAEKGELKSTYTKPTRFGVLRLHVTVTGTQCERVQIGTETKEVPIFEVRCPDISVPEDSLGVFEGSEETAAPPKAEQDLPF